MNNPGSTVYVRWYGKLLQGTVINDHDLMGMVAVRIPLQGGHPVALFTPAHVYESETAANGLLAGEPHKKMADDRTATSCKDSKPACVPTVSDHSRPLPTVSDSSTKTSPSEAWQAIQKFKEEHWDQEHNHLRIDALNDFYQLWRTAVAARLGISIKQRALSGSPAETPTVVHVQSAEVVCAAAVPQSHPLIETLAQVVPAPHPKLTKKQLRSTGRIQYTDSIQTSLFD